MEQRHCTKCGLVKPFSDFAKCRKERLGIRSICKPCQQEEARRYRAQYRETIRAKLKASKLADPGRYKEYQRRYMAKPEKAAARKVYTREYQKVNAAAKRARTVARRLRIANAVPKWADLKTISDFYKNCPPGHHVDHIIPIHNENVCGLHVIENLQYLPAKMNLVKTNKFDSPQIGYQIKEIY